MSYPIPPYEADGLTLRASGHRTNELEITGGEKVALVTLRSGPDDRAWINLDAEQLHSLAYWATKIANELDEREEAK